MRRSIPIIVFILLDRYDVGFVWLQNLDRLSGGTVL